MGVKGRSLSRSASAALCLHQQDDWSGGAGAAAEQLCDGVPDNGFSVFHGHSETEEDVGASATLGESRLVRTQAILVYLNYYEQSIDKLINKFNYLLWLD